jgi:hypothetical protein
LAFLSAPAACADPVRLTEERTAGLGCRSPFSVMLRWRRRFGAARPGVPGRRAAVTAELPTHAESRP